MVEIIDVTNKLVINYKSRDWCKIPYPQHPDGCPNYNKNIYCPPQSPRIETWLDIDKPHWFIVSEFNLSKFAQRMKIKHPNWSEKQSRCCLYWQNIPRKELRITMNKFIEEHPGVVSTMIPEAMGVQVIITARRLGIPIKTKPDDTVYKIALVGYPKNLKQHVMEDYINDTL